MPKLLQNGKEITGAANDAGLIAYDNTASGLEASTVKAAIDEVSSEVANCVQVTPGETGTVDDDPNLTVSTIVNNLTSTDTTRPLSSAQGKVLDDKITTTNNNLTWKHLGNATGDASIQLPSVYNELMIIPSLSREAGYVDISNSHVISKGYIDLFSNSGFKLRGFWAYPSNISGSNMEYTVLINNNSLSIAEYYNNATKTSGTLSVFYR